MEKTELEGPLMLHVVEAQGGRGTSRGPVPGVKGLSQELQQCTGLSSEESLCFSYAVLSCGCVWFSLKDEPGWVMAALALGSWPLGLFVEPESLALGCVPSFVARSSVVQCVSFLHDLLPSCCQACLPAPKHLC